LLVIGYDSYAKGRQEMSSMSTTVETLQNSRGLLEVAPTQRRIRLLRLALGVGVLGSVAAASLHADPGTYLRADPELGTLLRGIALIKAGLAALAMGLVYWRLARPISGPVMAAYLGGVWFMAGASMLVWELTHIGWGALIFHTGELTILLVAWREHRAPLRAIRR